jgi:polyphosphate kinase 2 (PPK2 family)
MKTLITKENQVNVNTFYHVSKTNSTGRLKVRRNGNTKVWKTRPDEFKIPVKYGLYEYGYLTEKDCNNWTID